MTVDQVQAKLGDDPYSVQLVWRRVDKPRGPINHVQWAVHDVNTGNGQGGYYSYEFLSQHDVEQYVRDMIYNMNARESYGEAWPSVEHYRYTDWEYGSMDDFANWLKRSVGL